MPGSQQQDLALALLCHWCWGSGKQLVCAVTCDTGRSQQVPTSSMLLPRVVWALSVYRHRIPPCPAQRRGWVFSGLCP